MTTNDSLKSDCLTQKGTEHLKKFHTLLDELRATDKIKTGTATLADYAQTGQGDLAEGIRTTMGLGDIDFAGSAEDAPDEMAVAEDYTQFYAGREMTPLAKLLPTLSVTGTAETKPGKWKLLYESEKSRVWAFVRMLHHMRQEADKGLEAMGERLEKIMKDLVGSLSVVIVEEKTSDGLWDEWSRAQDAGHTELNHSTERPSVRFKFFSKLMHTMKQEMLLARETGEVTAKELFEAYEDAEKKGKFKTAKGMSGVRRPNELASLMKWGGSLTKWGLVELWRQMEVGPAGKTAFFQEKVVSGFCAMVDNDQNIARYVLQTLHRAFLDTASDDCKTGIRWRLKVVEASAVKLKSIVKTFVLEWKVVKLLMRNLQTLAIIPAERMLEDFATIGVVFDLADGVKFKTESTGKKASLHPLFLELWETSSKVLVDQEHFGIFQAAEALNKNFENTCSLETLQKLSVPNIVNPWKDAHAAFLGREKAIACQENAGGLEEEKEQEEDDPMALPTRPEAIRIAAKADTDLYLGSSFVRTGDVAMDREKLAKSDLAKPRTKKKYPPQWNPQTEGDRRYSIFDPKGMRNPRATYVKGKNEYRGKVQFPKDEFDEFGDTWAIYARPNENPREECIDVLMTWNAEQDRGSSIIKKKLESLGLGGRVKKTTQKGLQQHIERRLWEGSPDGEIGELAGVAGMTEECFEAFCGPLPTRRRHLKPVGGISDNLYPEEIIPLRNPKKSGPQVSVSVQKAIFPPDSDKAHDGEKSIRNDEVWAPSLLGNDRVA